MNDNVQNQAPGEDGANICWTCLPSTGGSGLKFTSFFLIRRFVWFFFLSKKSNCITMMLIDLLPVFQRVTIETSSRGSTLIKTC